MKVVCFFWKTGHWDPERKIWIKKLSCKEYPMPIVDPTWKDRKKFMIALEKLEKKVYKPSFFKGWSDCRLCGRRLGSTEYQLKIKDTLYCWPDSVDHYVLDHQVKPPQNFIDFVFNSK